MEYFVLILFALSNGVHPAWVYGEETFPTKSECVSFVQRNEMSLYISAMKAYNFEESVDMIVCVDEKMLTDFLQEGMPT